MNAVSTPLPQSSALTLAARRAARPARPQTANQLHAWVRVVLGFSIPRTPIITGHTAPFDYVCHVFFEDTDDRRDTIVWANRGGGKTQLGAIVTLLDLLFKPGIQIRILAGSFEQSSKMYEYLRRMIESDLFADLVAGNITGRRVELTNGSRVEVLSQSERAVRGQRIHKLRCDEIELFEPEVWAAAQLVTHSGWCGSTFVRGAIDTLSTMHRPYGLMQELVEHARTNRRRIFRWGVLDTLQRCPPQRPCETCPLWKDCRGRAKDAAGFIDIDDAIVQQSRVDEQTWQAEMLCRKPSRSNSVYPDFDESTHIKPFAPDPDAVWVGGIDFGYRAPTALLYAFVDEQGHLFIIDEHVQAEWTTDRHIDAVTKLHWPRLTWIGADPAGKQRSEHTGVSTILLWQRAGFRMRTRQVSIEAGIAAVRTRIRRADGTVGLTVHPRCRRLIKALKMYHYDHARPHHPNPVKDGHDHIADALRYLVVNLQRDDWKVVRRKY